MRGLDDVVRRSLESFADKALDGSWTGRREREAVSLYVLGYLLRETHRTGLLRDATQVGIEFPVPQLEPESATMLSGRDSSKAVVCKDVVIWREPRMTCWDEFDRPTKVPAAILEWKFGVSGIHKGDVGWLEKYSAAHRNLVGYAVTANRQGTRLLCARVEDGVSDCEWLKSE